MLELRFPVLEGLDPLLLSSPSVRSGTTLVQRLLSSAPNTLLYGETVAGELEFFLNVYSAKASVLLGSRRSLDATRERHDAGEDGWIPDLTPDTGAFVEALGRSCFSWLTFCRDQAAAAGRPVWGMKYPGWQPHSLRLLRQAMPRCRLVHVFRRLAPTLRSAKSWGAFRSPGEARAFCVSWASCQAHALSLAGDPGVLLVDLDELTGSPEEGVRRLEAFTGAEGIRRELLARRINAPGAEPAGGYLEPTPLTDEEELLAAGTEESIRIDRTRSSRAPSVGA